MFNPKARMPEFLKHVNTQQDVRLVTEAEKAAFKELQDVEQIAFFSTYTGVLLACLKTDPAKRAAVNFPELLEKPIILNQHD